MSFSYISYLKGHDMIIFCELEIQQTVLDDSGRNISVRNCEYSTTKSCTGFCGLDEILNFWI